MPIYEYECVACDETIEALQKFSDDPLTECPHCGGELHKIMSLNAFQLKGDGWYVTDYKGKNSSNAATTSSDSDSKSESSAKKETKPAAKEKAAE